MRIGVDVGGTKISAIAIDTTGAALLRRRTATPHGNYDETLETVTRLVAEIENKLGRRGRVGVGIPGAISPASGLVKNANSTWLIGRPLDHDLAAQLARPVRVENDANCFTLSEARDGAAAGAGCVFGAILGTGVGGGIAIGGKVLHGRDAIAGEWGHNPLPAPDEDERPGPSCYCGRQGCIETFLSGPALARDAGLASGEEVARRAALGDGAAEAALVRYEGRLAKALATVVNLLDPDAIVLGGGLSGLARLYRNVPALMARHVFSDRAETPILAPRHGDDSGVRGAAWLWPNEPEP